MTVQDNRGRQAPDVTRSAADIGASEIVLKGYDPVTTRSSPNPDPV
jgi:hypothetical protein